MLGGRGVSTKSEGLLYNSMQFPLVIGAVDNGYNNSLHGDAQTEGEMSVM